MFFCFFFSSRRRHTRCSRDWSSDVCSSDLERRWRIIHSQVIRNAEVAQRYKRLGVIAEVQPYHAIDDRKSTRLNSSHGYISYAVFCLKKKKNKKRHKKQ